MSSSHLLALTRAYAFARARQTLLLRWVPRVMWLLGIGAVVLVLEYFVVPLSRARPIERKPINLDILELRCRKVLVCVEKERREKPRKDRERERKRKERKEKTERGWVCLCSLCWCV